MKSISNKITAILCIVLVIIFSIFSFINYEFTKEKVDDGLAVTQNKILDGIEFYINYFIQTKENELAQMSKKLERDGIDEESINKDMADFAAQGGYLLAYVGLEDDGKTMQSDGHNSRADDADGFDPRKRTWYKDALNGVLYGDPYMSYKDQQPVISFSTTIKEDGKIIGVLGADIPFKRIRQDIIDIGNTNGIYSFIIKDDSSLILHRDTSIEGKAIDATKDIMNKFKSG